MITKKFFQIAVGALLLATITAPANARNHTKPAAVGTTVGTVTGVGIFNGWFGSSAFGMALPANAGATLGGIAGAATIGGVAGVGTVAMLDAAIEPCRGFHALFDMNRGSCAYSKTRRH